MRRTILLALAFLGGGGLAFTQPSPVSGVFVGAPLSVYWDCSPTAIRCVESGGSREYTTIDGCADAASAGDTCVVWPGTYSEVVTASTSGTSGSEISFVANGSVTMNGWVVTGSYVRIIGFVIEGADTRNDGIYLQDSDFVEIWNNTLQNFQRDAIRTDSGGSVYQSDNSLFIGNNFTASALKDFQIRGNDNIIAYNESDAAETDFLYLFGQRNRLLNNYSHDVNAGAASHTDFIQTASDAVLGLGSSVYEANVYEDTSGSDHHCMNLENGNATLDVGHIFRRNVWSSSGNGGGQCYGLGNNYDNTKIYHETIALATQYVTADFGTGATGRSVLNNIFHQAWWPSTDPVAVYDDTPSVHDYNIFYDTGGSPSYAATITAEVNSQTNTDPVVTNASTRDFTLQVTSPAIGAGGALTTVTSASSTGTTFTVGDAAYFVGDNTAISQYGGALVVGDTITVGTDVVTVTSVSGDAITVTPSFTWVDGDAVYFGDDATPDIGAYPYKAGGYALTATYAVAGSTVTITPNDASLVRWAVCFDNGIPYEVDASSPYTCTVGSGVFSARVYPLYPSTTLWTAVTPG